MKIPFLNIKIERPRPPMAVSSLVYKASKTFGMRAYCYKLSEQRATQEFADEMEDLDAQLTEEHKLLQKALKHWTHASEMQRQIDIEWGKVPTVIATNAQEVLKGQVETQEKLLALEKTQAVLDQKVDHFKEVRKLRKQSKYRQVKELKEV
jgi:hypothetical protein